MVSTLDTVAAVDTLAHIILNGYENIQYNSEFTLSHLKAELVRQFPDFANFPELEETITRIAYQWSIINPGENRNLNRSQWIAVQLYDLLQTV